jgi:ABC-2 type transport system ATP-binding protein
LNPVIEISDLTRRFGAKTALAAVNLSLPRGAVYGLVGANGAGKTTLIKHILGLLRAESGTVRIFGLDPVAAPVGVLSRLGYLSEDHDLPAWMTINELMRYTRAFYPAWDDAYAETLRGAFSLDGNAKIKSLSRGQRARTGLITALAHRPELLVLDEPSSGLDPIVRRDILGAVIRTVAEEGRTVLFSSHLLEEVEQVADHVTMIHRGTIVLSAPLEEIRTSHHAVTLHFPAARTKPPDVAGVLHWEGRAHDWTAVSDRHPEHWRQAATAAGSTVVAERAASLDEIFVAHVGNSVGHEDS